MAIKYSLSMRPNPMDAEAPKKAYANAQAERKISLDDLCNHIAQHGSVWSSDIVNGVVKKLVKCCEELLLDGKSIELGSFGTFYVSIQSRGAVDFQSFTPASNIKRVSVNWAKSNLFKDLRNSTLGIKYERVLPKKADTEAMADYYGDGE